MLVSLVSSLLELVSKIFDWVTYPVYRKWEEKRARDRLRERCEQIEILQHDDHQFTFRRRGQLPSKDKSRNFRTMYELRLSDSYEWVDRKEFRRRVNAIGQGLRSMGLEPRGRLAFLANTRMEWFLTACACFLHNITVVTLYSVLEDKGILQILQESQATHLLTTAGFLVRVGRLLPQLPQLRCIIVLEDSLGEEPPTEEEFSVRLVPFRDVEGTQGNDYETSPPRPEDTCVLMYTSGSTGKPKGVLLLHSNIVSTLKAYQEELQEEPGDVYLGYLPLAHILELIAEFIFLMMGIPIGYSSPGTLMPGGPKLPKGSRSDFEVLQPTIIASVPLILERLLHGIMRTVDSLSPLQRAVFLFAVRYKQKWMLRGLDTPLLNLVVFRSIQREYRRRLKYIICGAAPLAVQTQGALQAILGIPVKLAYGLTESGAAGTCCQDGSAKLGIVGIPVRGCVIRLVNWEEGKYFVRDKPHARGEVVIGGPSVSPSYLLESDNSSCFLVEDGIRWVVTGDIGEVDADGDLRIVDRKKDLVKLQNGEYVALGKIEAILKSASFVQNICVCGDSLKSNLVAIVSAKKQELVQISGEATEGSGGSEDPCSDPLVVSRALELLRELGRRQSLKDIEVPAAIKLCLDSWSPMNGLLTPSFKLCRRNIQQLYAEDIERLYEQL